MDRLTWISNINLIVFDSKYMAIETIGICK